MRIIASADWHLDATAAGKLDPAVGMHSTWVESFGRLADLVQLCNDKDADLLLVGGDVFHTGRPVAEAVALALDILGRLKRTKVIFTNGNHDQQTVVLNQRTPIDAYLASQPWCYHTSAMAEVVEFEGLPLALVPWPKVAGISSEMRAEGKTAVGVASTGLKETIERLGEQLAGRTSLLTGHFVLDECSFDSGKRGSEVEQSNAAIEATVATKLLDSLPTARNLLGHIHTGQILSPKTRYMGSIYKVSFGEYGQEKGVEIIDMSDEGITNIEWSPLPGRELWNLDVPKSQALGKPLDLAYFADSARPGDRVKLKLGWNDEEDPEGLEQFIADLKLKGVAYELPREPKPRRAGGKRLSGASTSTSPMEAMNLFMDQLSTPAHEREELMEEFAELMSS